MKRKTTKKPHKYGRILTIKERQMVDALPLYDWNVTKAGLSVGYAKTYAKTQLVHRAKRDVTLSEAIERKRVETGRKTDNRRMRRMRNLDAIIENPRTTTRDKIAAMTLQARMCGWLSETVKHEIASRERVLTASEAEEARRLALLRFDNGVHAPAGLLAGDQGDPGANCGSEGDRPAQAILGDPGANCGEDEPDLRAIDAEMVGDGGHDDDDAVSSM